MASKTREKLIEVARQLFAHKGVAHTTMNDIANASAKGRRTIYTYFRNKKEIYNAVLEEESDRMVDSLREVVESSAPVDVRLREYIRRRLARYVAPSVSASLMAWLKIDSRRVVKVHQMARDKENSMLSDLLSEGCRTGLFRPERCTLLKNFITVALGALDTQPISADFVEERTRAIEAFVEFVMTDITVKKSL